MARYGIQWKRRDYIRLGQAIARFNKEVDNVTNEENKNIMPFKFEYKEEKQRITTRQELNEFISSLNRFQYKTSKEIYETESGEKITKWEYKEGEKRRQRAIERLESSIDELYEPTDSGFSRAQMGDKKLNRLMKTKKNLEEYQELTGDSFIRLRKRLFNIGSSDYEYRKASIYRTNMMNELYNMSNNSPEFKELYNALNKYKDPISFYNYVQNARAMNDFFEWYKNSSDYASFNNDRELVDNILEDLKEV